MGKRVLGSISKITKIMVGGAIAFSGTATAVLAQNNAELYGHLNYGFIVVDDGDTTTSEFADNSNAVSRFGVRYSQPTGQGTFKFNFETGLGLAGSSDWSQINDPEFLEWERTNIRKVDFSYEGSFGKVYLGQGSMASDGITGASFSGTDGIATSAVADVGGGFHFSDGMVDGTEPTVKSVFNDFDGGRLGRVRYDTPPLAGGGLILSAAVGENILSEGVDDTVYDFGLVYNGDAGDLQYSARIGSEWTDFDAGGDANSVFGSFAILHTPTGLNGKIAAGRRDSDNSAVDSDYFYTKLGKRDFEWFAWGKTHLSADFFWANDSRLAGDDGFAWGLQATQELDNYNAELYLAYRQYQYEEPGLDYQDIDIFMVAARWNF
ncbi:hypothetical protein J7399_11320 [Shimia sp. R9_1]|uniref:porin n=1 Tax=Shimia sp. R9_1 TaxID=2821111 RepID=UPI001AD956E3|nr:porin [Shimia sp. R9_1]MBO9408020.1 hypothetical protein [Shimia sp. R9_1]